jgi:hypothetical protein
MFSSPSCVFMSAPSRLAGSRRLGALTRRVFLLIRLWKCLPKLPGAPATTDLGHPDLASVGCSG